MFGQQEVRATGELRFEHVKNKTAITSAYSRLVVRSKRSVNEEARYVGTLIFSETWPIYCCCSCCKSKKRSCDALKPVGRAHLPLAGIPSNLYRQPGRAKELVLGWYVSLTRASDISTYLLL